MRPALRRAALAAACIAVFALAGCGKHVASNAPITYAPADTPYLLGNFKPIPSDVVQAWGANSFAQLSTLLHDSTKSYAKYMAQGDHPIPELTPVLNAIDAELANVHDAADFTQATGLSPSTLFAVYGIGDAPVVRIELASPDAFKAFWARVEKRAGVVSPTATIDKQTYRVIGGAKAKLHFLVAVEGKQLVATVVPADASPDLLKQLLGLTKPAHDASGRLAKVNSEHGYGDYNSGYLDLPKLVANLFDNKNAVTAAYAKAMGTPEANPACAREFASLAEQVPLITAGTQTYTAKEGRGSVDVQLSPALLGALTALKQPVPGMDEANDDSVFDMVIALPIQKLQAFIRGRAKAVAENPYRCPALQSLNKFAQTAANPPVQLPPEAASLLGARLVLDKWDAGPQIAARVLVASSNPAGLAQKIQQTLPQFALKTIPTDGKPVAFDLPPRVAAMLGGGNQGWIAANGSALVMGVGDGEDAKLPGTLTDSAGNGERMFRMHFDGKMFPIFASWMQRFAAMAPATSQTQLQRAVANYHRLGKLIKSEDMNMSLDSKGLHFQATIQHR